MALSRSLLGITILSAGLALAGCSTAPAQGLARGQELYDACLSCHGSDGAGNAKVGAPPIAGMSEWYVTAQLSKFKSGVRGAHPDDTNGLKMMPMAMGLRSDDDIKSVAAYVASMPAINGDLSLGGKADAGKARFATCSACHGADGAGNPALNAPPLTSLPDWYVVGQLQKFKAGVRGGNPKDTTGAQMRAMAGTLPDEQAMKDVAAYIKSLHK